LHPELFTLKPSRLFKFNAHFYPAYSIIKLEVLRKKLSKDPIAAKDFLVAAGIITPKGNLRKPYKNLSIPQDPA